MKPQTYWLRSETKKNEFRRAIVPTDAKRLILAGHKVVVEDWKNSIIPTEDYEKVGCEIVKEGSWINSDSQNIIVGLKALPHHLQELKHTHIYFAHAYKNQDGWEDLLDKFKHSGGKIIDLEFMVDEKAKRVCAFGYWAGYVGAALGVLFSKSLNLEKVIKDLAEQGRFKDKTSLINFIKMNTENLENSKAIVIGASGRSGKGAAELFREFSWEVSQWDKKETNAGGPFEAILDHEVFVNCVLSNKRIPPFIDSKILQNNKNLKIISDVSCDPDSECNTIPLYKEATNLAEHLLDVGSGVKLTAIDNLPSILPKESSEDFSSQLVSYLENLDNFSVNKSLEVYHEKVNLIPLR